MIYGRFDYKDSEWAKVDGLKLIFVLMDITALDDRCDNSIDIVWRETF